MRVGILLEDFLVLLEGAGGILEVRGCLLEDVDHLFEHRRLILEDPRFIRTFPGLLEHRAYLLECVPSIHRPLLLEIIPAILEHLADLLAVPNRILELCTNLLVNRCSTSIKLHDRISENAVSCLY
ncbi:hypothetical protein [Solibacillus sp. FSL W7-1324]|uniref:hypothetical protein n=1 Tax=Solibacillus sp. FSL W7-1324 TaxID=2921701 RepID=UPI0030FCF5A5